MSHAPDLARRRTVARFALTSRAALVLGILVTVIALPESWRSWPYAPFLLVHATLTIVIPVLYGALPTGRPLPELRRWLPHQRVPLLAAAAFIVGFVLVYVLVLRASSHAGDASWDLVAAYRALMDSYVDRYGLAATVIVGYLLLGVWPMFGEELFYRGFVLRGLLDGTTPAIAVIVSSALFGLRHAAQLVYFLPGYPIATGLAYFVWAFGISVMLGWIYVRTRSLWVCMALHSVNLILAPFAIAFLLA